MLFDKFSARSLHLANHIVMAQDPQPGNARAHAEALMAT
jgi:hypothetical protein